jgi:hypothetical protein
MASSPRRPAHDLDDYDTSILTLQLRKYRLASERGEDARKARDAQGAKLRNGQFFEDGVLPSTTPVESNIATALYERLVDSITRNKPIPQVAPIGHSDDKAARLLEGAILTNWESTNMQNLMKIGGLQVGFTRPCLWYVYWDDKARSGIGDIKTRIIPGYRCIIDDKVPFVQDMEYVGFRETASRAKIIQLFPSKTKEIEDAANSSESRSTPLGKGNPLRNTSGNFLEAVTRIAPGLSPTGRRTVNMGGGPQQSDPLAEDVEVEYLWIDDPTPQTQWRAKLDETRRPIRRIIRDEESNEIQFDHQGWETVIGPGGPMLAPILHPKTEAVMEKVIGYKYKHRRHVAWIPRDNVILYDVAWDGRIPLMTQRDNFPIDGYWSTGLALRLRSLAVARNLLFTVIFKSLKMSQNGSWLATHQSGMKKNELFPRPGVVYLANRIDENNIRPFPHNNVDGAYFTLINLFVNEMMQLLGITAASQGQADGRVDSAPSYDKLIEAASNAIVAQAQLLETTIKEWCLVVIDFIQDRYTHEHWVEVETDTGETDYQQASALAVRGEYAVRIETGSMVSYSESALFNRAKEIAALGFYSLPILGKVAGIPHYKAGLKEKGRIIAMGPQFSYLLGPSAATPVQQSRVATSAQRRSHHTNPASGK